MRDTGDSTAGEGMADGAAHRITGSDASVLREIAAITARMLADAKDLDARLSVLEGRKPARDRRRATPDTPPAP